MITWQQSDQPYILFFKLQKDIYDQKNYLKLEYQKCKIKTQLFLFPTLYYNEKKSYNQKVQQQNLFYSFRKINQIIYS
ncbi:unnamed protein product [Paramecium pentaurelia]|uniref:Uncharacterized protein n=1 Tax=Paramecium pentaurelia TaxID=43138 RepID=A0A8S1YLX1_9CILI|nr:unnamed protein product [Paramecium pentaurelia]